MAARWDLQANASLVTAPTWEPLSLEELRVHLGGLQDDDVPLVRSYLESARQHAEQYLGRAIAAQTWLLSLSGWAAEIPLPMAAPLQSVSSVEYYNTAGSRVPLSASVYTVDTSTEPGRILLGVDQTWPDLQAGRRGPRVFVTYVCGYASASAVPPAIKQGVRLLVGAFDRGRPAELSESIRRGAESLLAGVGIVREAVPCD